MKIRIAALQMPVTNDVSRNVRSICAGIKQAARAGAEILLTPEGSLSGYRHDFDHRKVVGALQQVTAFARLHSLGLALGTCFRERGGKCYNQLRFYRPGGEYLGFHSKTLTCGTPGAHPVGEINHYAVSRLKVFRWNSRLTIGGLICNDVWANPECTPMPDPHLTQRLAEKGARIIFHAVNGGRDGSEWSRLNWQYHEANLRMRARAARAWIVTVDNAHPVHLPCSSPGGVVDPRGQWACRAPAKGRRLFVHEIGLTG